MTFALRRDRPATYTRGKGRASSTPRILDAEPAQERTGEPMTFKPPILGLMLATDVSSIPDGGAAVLDNWVCLSSTVRARGGVAERNDAMTGPVRAMFAYVSGSTSELYAIDGAGVIYDVTATGAPVSTGVTGLVTTVWTAAQFTTSGGVYAVLAGEGNAPQKYDGTTWSAMTLSSGPTLSTISHLWPYANRLFFIEGGSTNAWYLAVDSIGGALTKFPLGGEFREGGTLVAGASWTADAGDKTEARCVFVSSEGEVAVYEGADPASWYIRGVFKVAKPCGQNCFLKVGGDLLIVTEDGVFAMSQIEQLDRAALANEAVSRNIQPLWREAAATSDLSLWQIVRHDREGLALVFIPDTPGQDRCMFVVNVQTGAWSRWTGIEGSCLIAFENELIIGGMDGRIMTGDSGGYDDGAAYTASYIGQFRMNSGGMIFPRLAKALVSTDGGCLPRVMAKLDYDTSAPPVPPACVPVGVAIWDTAEWDAAAWYSGATISGAWQGVEGSGTALAPCVVITFGQSSKPRYDLIRTDFIFEGGGLVG